MSEIRRGRAFWDSPAGTATRAAKYHRWQEQLAQTAPKRGATMTHENYPGDTRTETGVWIAVNPPHRCRPPYVEQGDVHDGAEWRCDCGDYWRVTFHPHPDWSLAD